MMTAQHLALGRGPLHGFVRQRLIVPALALSFSLAGCEQPAPPPGEPADVSRPAQIQLVSPAALGSDLRFPGRVRAVQRVELAFNVPGQIVELPIAEGEAVQAGALLARLDPASYQTALDVAQAELDAATAEYERMRRLWEKSQASHQGEPLVGDAERAFPAWRFATGIPVLATLPRVLALVSGDLRLVGVSPLTPQESKARTEEWQRARDRAPVGLIGPTQLTLPADAPSDERLMSDAFYAGQRSALGDLRWLWVGLLGLFSRRAWQRP
jgi:multidrug efflux pump subunit AcrA (membrane-fusion protein)